MFPFISSAPGALFFLIDLNDTSNSSNDSSEDKLFEQMQSSIGVKKLLNTNWLNMVYHKKRKTSRPPRGKVNENEMRAAVNAVLNGSTVYRVCKERGINLMTLKRYVRKCQLNPNTVCKPKFITMQIFTNEEETSLSDYLLRASKLHYGLSTKTTRKLAYEFAMTLSKRIPKSWKSLQIAGKQWLRGFMLLGEFFTNLKDVRLRHKFQPQNIYNVDETGLTTVQKPVKVIAKKGDKQVGRITSAERGTLVTVCCAVNAIENSIPPFFIFPRVHFKGSMINGGPPGCVGVANPSGWMNVATFLEWMKHFIQNVKCSPANPVLLLLDNHESHVSIVCLDLAKKNGITMLSFPPHCSHKLQPLDRSVYGPLKRYYNAACDDWIVSNPRPMTIYDIASVVRKAYTQAFTLSNISAGFAVAGVEPFNPNIFSDNEFLSSYVTDCPEPITANPFPGVVDPVHAPAFNQSLMSSLSSGSACSVLPIQPISDPGSQLSSVSNNISHQASLEKIRPFPKAGSRKSIKGRKRQRTRILTDTPTYVVPPG
nr:MFS-type transporter clz9-like [Hydra vulgaris]